PPLAGPLRRPQGRRRQAPQGAGGRERPPQAPGRRAGPGQADAPGGGPKKLLSPGRRRRAVEHLVAAFGVSQRRACRVLGQHRSTQRKRPAARAKEAARVKRMRVLVAQHPRCGYRRVWALLRAEGWRVNRKRVFRRWRREGLKVPRKKRK